MSNLEIENYIKDLPPELMEKARECKSASELLQLADDNDIDIPVDALQGIAGGCGDPVRMCPNCNIELKASGGDPYHIKYTCPKCGHTEERNNHP